MSKRLQVLVDGSELRRWQKAADAEGMTLSEWVRQTLRRALRARPAVSRERKLEAVRAAGRHAFPTADVDRMLAEIERGYGSEAYPDAAPTKDSDPRSSGQGTVHEPGT